MHSYEHSNLTYRESIKRKNKDYYAYLHSLRLLAQKQAYAHGNIALGDVFINDEEDDFTASFNIYVHSCGFIKKETTVLPDNTTEFTLSKFVPSKEDDLSFWDWKSATTNTAEQFLALAAIGAIDIATLPDIILTASPNVPKGEPRFTQIFDIACDEHDSFMHTAVFKDSNTLVPTIKRSMIVDKDALALLSSQTFETLGRKLFETKATYALAPGYDSNLPLDASSFLFAHLLGREKEIAPTLYAAANSNYKNQMTTSSWKKKALSRYCLSLDEDDDETSNLTSILDAWARICCSSRIVVKLLWSELESPELLKKRFSMLGDVLSMDTYIDAIIRGIPVDDLVRGL